MSTPVSGRLAAAAAGALMLLGLTGPAASAAPTSLRHTTAASAVTQSSPAGRVWAAWAYDPEQRDVVLFGGDGGVGGGAPGPTYGDTWTWNGAWTQQQPATSPPPTDGASMAWDPATRQLLLFGGGSSPSNPITYYNGTWDWNGTTWTQLSPASSPSPRNHTDMVYDAAMHKIILFGGDSSTGYSNQTWAWNGTNWTPLQLATSPSARDTDSMIYDQATGTVLLYGGFNATGRLSDTWSFNGTTWTALFPATSPGAVSPSWQAADDVATGQPLLYGGDLGNDTYIDGTWAWNGTTWVQLSPPASAGTRAYGSMTYDPAIRQVLLFGGATRHAGVPVSTVWEWNGTNWRLAPAPACPESGLDIWLNTQLRHVGGSAFTSVYFTNLTASACILRGFPAVTAVSLSGQQIGSSAGSPPYRTPTVTLKPGATAKAELTIAGTGNFRVSSCEPVTAAGLEVSPPKLQASRFVPFPFRACSRPGPVYLTIGPVTQ